MLREVCGFNFLKAIREVFEKKLHCRGNGVVKFCLDEWCEDALLKDSSLLC